MQCKSSGISPGENRISYVVNAGPSNVADINTGLENRGWTEYSRPERSERDAKMYTIFFDHFCDSGPWADVITRPDYGYVIYCTSRISVDNIASMDGTSMTILLSENEDAGHWIWRVADRIPRIPVAVWWTYSIWDRQTDLVPMYSKHDMEALVGFTFPRDLSSIATGEIPTYIPLRWGTDDERSPLFINEGRRNSGARITERGRTARPSSGHPGIVNAAFVDGGVRPLRDDMDKTLFVRLARPGSGVILNPKDLGW